MSRAKRIGLIKHQIAKIDLVCSGTLLERTKVCGKPNCRCALDPANRHGPYFEWNRWQEARLRHTAVSREQARQIRRAQNNYQRLLRILDRWEDESAEAILGARWLKIRKHKT